MLRFWSFSIFGDIGDYIPAGVEEKKEEAVLAGEAKKVSYFGSKVWHASTLMIFDRLMTIWTLMLLRRHIS
jgi:hypothetical protein